MSVYKELPFLGSAAVGVACLVRFVLVDAYALLTPLIPGHSNPVVYFLATHTPYDPSSDHVLNTCVLSSWMGYWSIGLVCTFLDLFPRQMHGYKIQGDKMRAGHEYGSPSPFPSFAEWWQAVRISMLNLAFTSWVMTIPLWGLWKGGWSGDRILTSEADRWDPSTELLKIALCAVVVDSWFYWTHRALHITKPINLYKLIHKFHHRFKAPAAVASMYANPIEFAVGNLGGVALGPVLTNCHPYTAYWWFAFALVTTGGSHSGYAFCAAEGHDAHHEFFNYHFGVGGPWDMLCGTDYVGSKLHEKNIKEKAAVGNKKES